jgi:ankyrin repeat protein
MQNTILQKSINKAIDDIERMISVFNINYDDLFDFEKLIVNNNITDIKIFVQENNNSVYDAHLLCNGFYKKKFECHPMRCHNHVCYKTAVYYALWINCYYYYNIFYKIFLLAKLSSKDILSEFIYFIKNIPCVCHTTNNNNIYYDHTSMNFKIVHDFLKEKMDELIKTFEDNKSNATRKISNIKNLYLECKICEMTSHKIDYVLNEIDNHDKIGNIMFEIKCIWDDYLINCEIVHYLFSVQSYEYFNYYLNHKMFEIDNALTKILFNKCSNINFCKNDDENILYNTMKKDCKTELIVKLIDSGMRIPKNKNLNTMFEKEECKIENIKTFLKKYDANFFSNESLLTILKQNLMRTHKIEIVDIFASRGLLANAFKILLESETSYNILLNLYATQDVVVSKITIGDAFYCIKLEKYKELDLILQNNKTFSNELFEGITPIMIAIKENKLKCLQLLLQHGADPFLIHNNTSPIMMTIVENRLEMLDFLLANWMKDCATSDNTSHIMLSIKENNIEALKLLLKHKADPYSSIGSTTPTLYSITNDKIVALECLLEYGSCTEHDYNPIANNPYKQLTPLMMAIDKNKLVAFELLIKYGANPFTYIRGLNTLHYAIGCNRFELVTLIKDYVSNNKYLINELTTEVDKRHSLFLAVKTNDPIKMTDLLLQNDNITFNHTLLDGSNILYHILMSKIKISIKNNLFKRYIQYDIDLINHVDNTPLVVYAVENNLYDIVVMIINKLILTQEITITGFTKLDNDIVKIISITPQKKLQIIAKNKNGPNYYSLVLGYLRQGKIEESDDIDDTEYLNNNDIIVTINMNFIIYHMMTIMSIISIYFAMSFDPIFNIVHFDISNFYQDNDYDDCGETLHKIINTYYDVLFFDGNGNDENEIKHRKYIINDISDLNYFIDNCSILSDSDINDTYMTALDEEYTDKCFPICS